MVGRCLFNRQRFDILLQWVVRDESACLSSVVLVVAMKCKAHSALSYRMNEKSWATPTGLPHNAYSHSSLQLQIWEPLRPREFSTFCARFIRLITFCTRMARFSQIPRIWIFLLFRSISFVLLLFSMKIEKWKHCTTRNWCFSTFVVVDESRLATKSEIEAIKTKLCYQIITLKHLQCRSSR